MAPTTKPSTTRLSILIRILKHSDITSVEWRIKTLKYDRRVCDLPPFLLVLLRGETESPGPVIAITPINGTDPTVRRPLVTQ